MRTSSCRLGGRKCSVPPRRTDRHSQGKAQVRTEPSAGPWQPPQAGQARRGPPHGHLDGTLLASATMTCGDLRPSARGGPGVRPGPPWARGAETQARPRLWGPLGGAGAGRPHPEASSLRGQRDPERRQETLPEVPGLLSRQAGAGATCGTSAPLSNPLAPHGQTDGSRRGAQFGCLAKLRDPECSSAGFCSGEEYGMAGHSHL